MATVYVELLKGGRWKGFGIRKGRIEWKKGLTVELEGGVTSGKDIGDGGREWWWRSLTCCWRAGDKRGVSRRKGHRGWGWTAELVGAMAPSRDVGSGSGDKSGGGRGLAAGRAVGGGGR